MSYTRVTESGRTYNRISMWECADCLARLDDDLGIGVHEAWHTMTGDHPGHAHSTGAPALGRATPPGNPLRAFARAVLSGEVQADDETAEALRQAEEIELRREQEEAPQAG